MTSWHAQLILALLTFCTSLSFAQSSRTYGDISVMSNKVEKGITQSNKNPSVEAGFGYLFGTQGKIGFDAGSVSFPDENANVALAIFGEYKFIFSPTSDLKVRNDLIRYYSEGLRNNTIISLDQNFSGYHILLSRDDNFEGTKTHRSWYAFHKDWPWTATYLINTTIGYSTLELDDYANYFDTLVGITYQTGNLAIALNNTWTSKASQFNGEADLFFALVVTAKF